MLNAVSTKDSKQSRLILDPRTKLFIVLIISVFMMSGTIKGYAIYPRMVLASVPFILLLTVRKWKAALFYALSLLMGSFAEHYLVFNTDGIVSILVTMLSGLITRFIPCIVMGYYLVNTTTVSEFVAGMERMKTPQAITIPMSVMFRFFPTILEEYRSIRDAMRMRNSGSGFSGQTPINVLEYRFVPLMMSIVKIGEELSVSALTRGLGSPGKRTNVCRIGFSPIDFVIGGIVLAAAVFYSIL